MQVMKEQFAQDRQFALATTKDDTPSVRYVDTYYQDGSFYIVTYASSRKVQELTANPRVALCSSEWCQFSGEAFNIGHPLDAANAEIRKVLTKVFEPWYFAHNNEDDLQMCYVRVDLKQGIFTQGGTGYKVDFTALTAETFPFPPGLE